MNDLIDKNYKYLLLSRCYLFSDLSIEELDSLSINVNIKESQAGEVIFNKNDQGSEMFLIARGKVTITSLSEKGGELKFGTLGEGDIFGEISLFDNHERTATITAVEPTQLLIIERQPFLGFIGRNPSVAIKLLSAMATRLRYTDQIYEDTVFGPIEVRLAKRLLGIAKLFGEQDFDGIKITIKLSEKELAKLLGASLEHVKLQLTKMQENMLISYDNGDITLLDKEKLDAIVEPFQT